MVDVTQVPQILEAFRQQLEKVLTVCRLTSPELIEQWLLLQAQFQAEVLPLLALGVELSPSGLSALTELHRHMRLLAIEFNFLQAAQRPETAQQRLIQIRERLAQMQEFTRVLVGLGE